jgi:hypothetical protein
MELLLAALHSIPIRSFAMTPLRHRMLEDMAVRNLAKNTQSAYLQQIGALRKTLQPPARRPRSGRDSRLSGPFDADPQALREQRECRDRRIALPLQGDAQTQLGRRRDSDAQEAVQAASDS